MTDLWPCPWKKWQFLTFKYTQTFRKRWTKAKTKRILSFESRTNSFECFDWKETITNAENMEACLPIWNCLRNKKWKQIPYIFGKRHKHQLKYNIDDKKFPIRITLTYTSRIDTKLFVLFDRILLSKKKRICIYRQQLKNKLLWNVQIEIVKRNFWWITVLNYRRMPLLLMQSKLINIPKTFGCISICMRSITTWIAHTTASKEKTLCAHIIHTV